MFISLSYYQRIYPDTCHFVGYDEVAFELKRLNLKTISFDGIFEKQKLNAFANNNNNYYSNSSSTPKMKPSASNGYLSSGPGPSNNNGNNYSNSSSNKEKSSNGYVSSKETGGYKSSGSFKENKSSSNSTYNNSNSNNNNNSNSSNNTPVISNIALIPTSAMFSMSIGASTSSNSSSKKMIKTPSKTKFSKTDEETDREEFTPVAVTKVKKMVILKQLDPKKVSYFVILSLSLLILCI